MVAGVASLFFLGWSFSTLFVMADSNSNKSASNTSSDQVSMQITSVKLNGHNYLLWAQAIKVALGARKSNGSFS